MSTSQSALEFLTVYLRQDEIRGNWHVGTAFDPRQRLFEEKAVGEATCLWAYDFVETEADARVVVASLVEMGCHESPGAGRGNLRAVYIYNKTVAEGAGGP